MAGNRAAMTAYILQSLEDILPGNTDVERYKSFLEGMSDKAFEAYAEDLKSGRKFLTLTAPNFAKPALDENRNLKLAKKFGVKFFNKLWVEGEPGMPTYLTSVEYLVVKLPMRIASQRLAKKQSIPKTQRNINALTGQPTGDSKGASISYPELRVCMAMGLENTMVELMKYRGGDQRGGAALNASLIRTGEASLNVLKNFASGVQSTATLRTYLNAAHLQNTL